MLASGELAEEFCKHDALIITSVWETGPIVAWEAMSHRLPVLSSRYTGSGTEGALVDEVNCLLFRVGDMRAAANSAMKLTSPEMKSRLVEGGLELLRQRYSREASVAKWSVALQQGLDFPPLAVPKPSEPEPPSGRLDRFLGFAWGERVRRCSGCHIDIRVRGASGPIHDIQIRGKKSALLARWRWTGLRVEQSEVFALQPVGIVSTCTSRWRFAPIIARPC